MQNPRERGTQAEQLAFEYLHAHGLKPVARNFNCRLGEVDLIMQSRETLVFIEVRMRSSRAFGSAAESVTHTKQRRIVQAARQFLQQRERWSNHACRFDVIAINGPDAGEIEWIQDAFQVSY